MEKIDAPLLIKNMLFFIALLKLILFMFFLGFSMRPIEIYLLS